VVKIEDNRGRREGRALASREVEPAQLGLAGAAQIGWLARQLGKDAGVESGLHRRLDCSAFEDRMRVRRLRRGLEKGLYRDGRETYLWR
jgi:hypothetical protein